MDLRKQVGIRLKAIRQDKQLSQAELAERIDRTVDAVSAIERGKSLPGYETLERMATALGVPVTEFFSFQQTATSPRRARLIAEIHLALGKLSDKDLARATDIIKTLAG
ncbi:helix-turn-helix domain-containing protein [Cucumibacter marinus]|uniref:helix-turn-helix domain-containing protein n=1 Tax=Cucumibacter marinus TaxID=1121252 RepID=UPI0004066131|nr:helix-turn-helix transcriptional regulator [Cucumibacter marinus]